MISWRAQDDGTLVATFVQLTPEGVNTYTRRCRPGDPANASAWVMATP